MGWDGRLAKCSKMYGHSNGALGSLTQSHLKPKVTVKQFSGYRKIKSIYVETILLFKVTVGMVIILKL